MPRLFLYVVAVVLLGVAISLRLWFSRPQVLPKNQQIKLVATLEKEPKISDYRQVLLIGDSRVFVDLYPRFRVGDRLLVEGAIDTDGNIYDAKVAKVGHRDFPGAYFAQLRAKISQNLLGLLPSREATLVAGTVLGVENIEREFREALIKTGTIHVVVVSGQNLTIVAGIFMATAKFVGRKRSLFLATSAVFAYAFLTGFEPPVVRASLMVLASSLAVYFGRQSLVIWNLILAAAVIILIWPQAILEISFQLTFAATLGIMTLGQDLSAAWQKIPFFGQNAAIATSAYIFTAPLIIFYFGRLSALAPVANILVVEAVFPIMVLGFLAAFASLVFSPLAAIFAYLAYVPAFYFVRTVELFSGLPTGQLAGGRGNLVLVLSLYALIFILTVIWRKKLAILTNR